jgi:Flp pilus assembly protein TadD
MKKIKTRAFPLFMVLILAAVTVLPACSSGGSSVQKEGDPDALPPGFDNAQLPKNQEIFTEEIKNPGVRSNLLSDDHERAGDIDFHRGHIEMAYIQYTKSLRGNPENVRVRYKRGLLFLVAGMSGQAKRDFRRVLQSDPDHALAFMGLGQALFGEQDYDGARRNFIRALEIDSTLWKCHSYMGVISDYEKMHDKALVSHLNAIELNPDNGLLFNNLGLCYYFQGDYDRAVQAFHKALETRPEVKRIHNNLGLALAKAGRDGDALQAFKAGGGEAQAYNNLGCIYLWKGKNELAVQSFEKAIELRPEFYTKANENIQKAQDVSKEEPFQPREKPSYAVPVPVP